MILEKYISEKEKHEATKKVLDKAISMAALLLQEIQRMEINQTRTSIVSPLRMSYQNPLIMSIDTIRSFDGQ